MNKILKLPKNLISKIAAGEVVERPASVVKELVENSLDAGATEVTISIEQGGKKSITITDNGEGMSETDALNSFILHTTSKIKSEDDLERILTFGFRGEALASISSISETIIHTSNPASKPVKVIIENSELISNIQAPRTQGTTITVTDIFRHLPARKRFLKTDSTEYRHIYFEVTKFAISRPDVRIKLYHNDRQIFDLQKTESMKQRILSLFKDLKAEDLLEFKINNNGIDINGYILHPSKLSSDNNKQYLFLNNRFVIDRTLNRAIKDGYSTTISREKQPAYFLNIKLDPKTIDINIHPRKLEVKIDNVQTLYQMLRFSLDKKLSNHLRTELGDKISSFTQSENNNFTYNRGNVTSSFVSDRIQNDFRHPQPNFNNDFKNLTNNISKTINVNEAINFSKELLNEPEITLNKFMQVFDTYIIIEKNIKNVEKLLVIDQHAAHERINYEKYLNKFKNNEVVDTQSLLLPVELVLEADVIEKLVANKTLLSNKTGINFEVKNSDKIIIKSQPINLTSINFYELIKEIIDSIEKYDSVESEEFKHKLAAVLACHNSIRAGRKMFSEEIAQLIKDLFKCENSYACPHGRPIIWELTKYELETKFERKK